MENNQISDKTQNKTTSIIAWRWWIGSLFILLLAISLQMIASSYPQVVETYYSRKIYPYIGQLLSLINSVVRFSVAEILLLSLSLGVTTWIIWQLKQFYEKRLTAKALFVKNLWRLITIGNVGLLLFLLLWGFNYQRQPLIENLQLVERKPDQAELLEICQTFISATNKSYQEAVAPTIYFANSTNNSFSESLPPSQLKLDWKTLNNIIEQSFQKEVLLKGIAPGSYGPAKAVYFSSAMSHFGISGVFIPLTAEPNVNINQTDSELPFTMAHEKAHQRGFAQEDEANFLAFLACVKSENAYCRYSGYLMATTYLLNTLHKVAPDKYKETYKMLDLGPRTDLKTMYKFWAQYRGNLSKVSDKINNTYLKANRVRSGIESYNQVVGLIVSYHFTHSSSSNTKIESISTDNNH